MSWVGASTGLGWVGEGTGFYIDEQDGQDFELDGNGITAWFDRLTMSGCANGDDGGL